MKKLLGLLYTIRYLKYKQIAYRLYYLLRKPKACTSTVPEKRGVLVDWAAPAFAAHATDDGEVFTFLAKTAQLNGDWNSAELPKLWLYNLHYQDDLNSIGADERLALCKQLVDDWISANPPLGGNGWEPYCISIRAVNWVKWLSRLSRRDVKPEWVESLASQVDALAQRLEYHILANHLFSNAKALVFAGAFFGGKKGNYWLRTGLKLLDQEVYEQFLEDGAHFELSPMYHATLVWDLADLICLQQITKLPELQHRAPEWTRRFVQGIEWLQWMVHPDKHLSFFNDTTLGIAPTLNDLLDYAEVLGLKVPSVKGVNQLQSKLLQDSGYAVIDWPANHRLIADVGRVGPDYQPGHAHADTLSCEFSLFGQRVLVNSGICQYGEDDERQRQRSTAAHNTVEVDGENSSEVWAGFRVARRARPLGVGIADDVGRIVLDASHDGYRRLSGKVTHHRRWVAEPSVLTITDKLYGHYRGAIAYWHLHPEIELVRLHEACFHLILHHGQAARLSFTGAQVDVIEGTWHPGFGRSVKNLKLVLSLRSQTLQTKIEYGGGGGFK